jgi:hypothetical protein
LRREYPLALLASAAMALAALLAAFGWFEPAMFPDSHGYISAGSAPEPWGEERHPLYGWMVSWSAPLGGLSAVPPLQFGLHAAAAFALYGGARVYGFERLAALALALAALFNQALVIWGRAVLPEMPAISFLLIALAGILVAAARPRLFWPLACVIALAVGESYTLRPIALPAVVVLPLLYALLQRRVEDGWRPSRVAALFVLIAIPFLCQSFYRLHKVGDFGLVSFSGFGVSGIAAQVLTPDLVPRLDPAHRGLATQIIAAKDRAIGSGLAAPLFRNSTGEPSFRTTALDGFDTLARNFDGIMWGEILKLRAEGETWVAFNARMGKVNAAILRAAPERWLFWMVGATSRLVGRLLTYNTAFLLALGAFACAAILRIMRGRSVIAAREAEASWTPLVLVVGAFVVVQTALCVVAAFPALRYTDAGGMLLAALPLYGLFRTFGKTSSDAPT